MLYLVGVLLFILLHLKVYQLNNLKHVKIRFSK
mgnify:CR=1 FL=1